MALIFKYFKRELSSFFSDFTNVLILRNQLVLGWWYSFVVPMVVPDSLMVVLGRVMVVFGNLMVVSSSLMLVSGGLW